ncbi:methionine sulfoxide oxidase MICAL3 protein [Phytophthora cinnamomi]|uniref:methionine sulfoxide oxidase MICAL3 protein n=1 Tax=Phytophthora cinnamomi TaxID=4785 RepID=UPI003559AC58|nr:methionine sulfoxide oxidase MICAL3 protein [Phytophthora cinnamomi]
MPNRAVTLSSSAVLHNLRLQGRRPPVHDGSRDSTVRPDRQDVYIGEGLIGPAGTASVGRLDGLHVDIHDKASHHRRKLLDYLAIDVGEKYLDDIYREDESCGESSADEGDDEPGRLHGFRFRSTPSSIDGNAATIKPRNPLGRRERVRKAREVAWQKVRRFLVEEEEMAIARKNSLPQGAGGSTDVEEGLNIVKLLDSMAQFGDENVSHSGSISSDADAAAVMDSSFSQAVPVAGSKNPHRKFADRIDRVGNKLTQLLQRGQAGDHESSDATKSSRSQPASSYSDEVVRGGSQTRMKMLELLEQVSRACLTTELTEASMVQISARLALIGQIVREDGNNKHKRRFRRPSSAQWSSDSGDCDIDLMVEFSSDRLSASLGNLQAKVVPTVLDAFKAFELAEDLTDTIDAFDKLLKDCGLNGISVEEPWYVYYHIKAAVYNKLSFRQKQFFKLLDARFNTDLYKQKPAVNKRVCIVGAGPVGLRAAVELALLGSHVIVLEKRTKFSRENMLHLWPWVVQDLAALGAKVLFRDFCKSKTYFHVSTRLLQVILLKVALLLGAKVHSVDFEAIIAPGLEETGSKPFYTLKTNPQIPVTRFTAVLGATGVNDKLAEPARINRFVFCNTESLGIVCYFPNLGTPDETKVKEFAWTTQLKHQMLNKMREVGIDLENVVYSRGDMHYLIMTPKCKNLLDHQVVKLNHPSSADLVEDDNINTRALHSFVNSIINFVGIPKKTEFARVSLVDFSPLSRAEKAASILTSHGNKLYVGLIGDSLLEPVWHEGVGTCRGFLSALDAVWMITQIDKKDDKQLLADREVSYRVVQRLSGLHRDKMKKNMHKYTADPKSRYVVHFPRVI